VIFAFAEKSNNARRKSSVVVSWNQEQKPRPSEPHLAEPRRLSVDD
jgi:hypothetical protein